MYSIGVDIGGMSIKVGIVDETGNIIVKCVKETECDVEKCVDNIYEQIMTVINDSHIEISQIRGVGIGCPGSVDRDTNTIGFLPNLGWNNVPIAELLSKKINLRICVGNDASAAVLGEYIYGVAKGYNDAIMITLGTGVGGGFIVNKKLFEGGKGKGGEPGHVTLILGGEKCGCGRSGCIESYVSASALIRQTKEAMLSNKHSKLWDAVDGDIEKVNGKTAFDMEDIDQTAKEIIDKYIMYLSESIMNLLNIFRPDIFIIGGGISKQGEKLTDRVTEYCKRFNYGYSGSPATKIVPASLGNDAGIIGAAALLDV